MQLQTIDWYKVIDVFLLLLIGVGPKIALVPFLSATESLDTATRARVIRKMLVTASVTALALVLFGGILTRLLHFSPGALAIAGGLILLVIATGMMIGRGAEEGHAAAASSDPMSLATYPLAVPYLLNPAGIVVLVTFSAEAKTAAWFGVMIGLLVLVIGIDIVVFRWANRVSEKLDQNRMLVTEKIFSFLLAAVAVQLVLYGLNDVGVIHLAEH